jgi:hypothetical protein
MTTTMTKNVLPSVYFTTLKRISTDRIRSCFQAVGVIDYIDRVPKRGDNIRDEVFIYFKDKLKLDYPSSSEMFFNIISNNGLVKLYYTVKYYWKVFPNRSKKNTKQAPPAVPKLSLNKTPSNEDYEYKLSIKDMTIRDLEGVIDKQNMWLDNNERMIKDLKDLVRTIDPQLLKIYEMNADDYV